MATAMTAMIAVKAFFDKNAIMKDIKQLSKEFTALDIEPGNLQKQFPTLTKYINQENFKNFLKLLLYIKTDDDDISFQNMRKSLTCQSKVVMYKTIAFVALHTLSRFFKCVYHNFDSGNNVCVIFEDYEESITKRILWQRERQSIITGISSACGNPIIRDFSIFVDADENAFKLDTDASVDSKINTLLNPCSFNSIDTVNNNTCNMICKNLSNVGIYILKLCQAYVHYCQKEIEFQRFQAIFCECIIRILKSIGFKISEEKNTEFTSFFDLFRLIDNLPTDNTYLVCAANALPRGELTAGGGDRTFRYNNYNYKIRKLNNRYYITIKKKRVYLVSNRLKLKSRLFNA